LKTGTSKPGSSAILAITKKYCQTNKNGRGQNPGQCSIVNVVLVSYYILHVSLKHPGHSRR
jgi:hypothetical protein